MGALFKQRMSDGLAALCGGSIAPTDSSGDLRECAHLMQFPRVEVAHRRIHALVIHQLLEDVDVDTGVCVTLGVGVAKGVGEHSGSVKRQRVSIHTGNVGMQVVEGAHPFTQRRPQVVTVEVRLRRRAKPGLLAAKRYSALPVGTASSERTSRQRRIVSAVGVRIGNWRPNRRALKLSQIRMYPSSECRQSSLSLQISWGRRPVSRSST
jgi:hypothetical protein